MTTTARYATEELRALRRYDVKPTRAARKVIFRYKLWRPPRQLRESHRHGIPSHDGPPRAVVSTQPPVDSCAARSPAVFGCLNIRSLLNKFDDVAELCRDRHIDLLCLTETWHDVDSAVLGRLRGAGFNVVDRPRPRVGTAAMTVNHGGVVVIAAAGVVLSPIVIDDQPTTFELVCVRATVGRSSAIVVVLYRPGSAAVQQKFFDELTAILDRVATYQEPIYITGDFNIRLDRVDDPWADQLRLLVDCYGLVLQSTGPTHKLGGTLDAVITHDATGRPNCVEVVDTGLSDHFLLCWEVNLARDEPPLTPVCSRPWRRLDIELLRSALSASRFCRPEDWPSDTDDLAALYADELNSLLDRLLPLRHFVRRQRPSDPWFDKDCRVAKRSTRRLERAYAAANRRAAAATSSCSAAVRRDANTAVATAAAAKAAWYDQRRAYRQLRHRKCTDFWCGKLEANKSNPRQLWRTVDDLLGRGRVSESSAIDVEAFSRFFATKVANVRLNTSNAPPASFSHMRPDVVLRCFSPLTTGDVIDAVRQLPDKFSAADPVPTSVLKQVIDVIAPFVVELFNRSLSEGHFPAVFKEAFITPVVKKPGLDVTDTSSYRPISNLSVLSKLLERLVVRQLMSYLTAADLLPRLQSGFRSGHSTETAVLRVLADILQAVDRGDSAALILLDLSAAFDTVDHSILLQRLQTSFGVCDIAHRWFWSYLADRNQYVRRGPSRSSVTYLVCGVPQGSVLGPILFVLYTADLLSLIESYDLSAHLYADDTQVYGSCAPAATDSLSSRVAECTDAIAAWMRSNRLQLNPDKTEVLWCATGRRQHQLPTSAMSIAGVPIAPAPFVRDLGVYIDADLSMRTHVQRTVSRCFAALRQLRQIRRCVPTTTFQTLVVALVHSRLDYGNSVLVGVPAYLLRRLQSVLNAAARLIFHLKRSDHITDALVSLHWLRVQERIQYKVAVLAYRVLSGSAPRYLGPLTRVADVPGRRTLRSAATNRLTVPSVKLRTVGSRAFPAAASSIWNSLPDNVASASTLQTFQHDLKTFLFRLSYPDIIL